MDYDKAAEELSDGQVFCVDKSQLKEDQRLCDLLAATRVVMNRLRETDTAADDTSTCIDIEKVMEAMNGRKRQGMP